VRTISALRPGTEVRLGVVRDGQPLDLVAQLDVRGAD